MDEVAQCGCVLRLVFAMVLAIVKRAVRWQAGSGSTGLGDAEVAVRMVEGGFRSMPLRGFQLMSGGKFSPALLEAIVLALNGRFCAACARLYGRGAAEAEAEPVHGLREPLLSSEPARATRARE